MTRLRKRGIELSINFLVMLMIAVVVFGFGIFFVGKIFSLGKDVTSDISSQQKKQIEELLLSRGQRVTVIPQTLKLKAGENGLVSVGVLNVLDDTQPAPAPPARNFRVIVVRDSFIPLGSTQAQTTTQPVRFPGTATALPPSSAQCIIPLATGTQGNLVQQKIFAEQDTNVFSFPVSTKGAQKGTHVLMVIVAQSEGSLVANCYDSPQQVLVIVE